MSGASSIVAALGGGSGIDMTKLAGDLANAQFALRNERLAERTDVLERRISAASSLKNSLSLLAGALGDRVRSGDLSPSAAAADSGVAAVSVAPGANADGAYSLEVTQLAAGQILTSKAYASADAKVGAGTLTLRFGTVQGTGFTADSSRAAIDIALSADDTLATLAQKITASGSGVTAYVANTGSGAQLVMKGDEGAKSGFTVTGTGASASGKDFFGNPRPANPGNINYLDWSPNRDTGQRKQAARDAAFRFDGVEMTSASNTVSGLPGGMTLTLTGTNAGNPTQIRFTDVTPSITSAMGDLVGALNEIVGELNAATAPLTGDLARDPGARALKRTLSGLGGIEVMPNAPAGAPRTLSDLGLAIERDGTFRLDTARLRTALDRDPSGVAAMFTSGLYGVYASIDRISRSASSTGDPGSLAGSIARFQSQSSQVSEDAAKLLEQQERLRTAMVARFAQADIRVGRSQSTLSFLQSQIDAWNGAKD